MLTPSQLFCEHTRGEVDPPPKVSESRAFSPVEDNDSEPCALCGAVRPAGVMLKDDPKQNNLSKLTMVFGANFNDMDQVGRTRFVCDSCRQLFTARCLPLTGNVLITKEKVLRFEHQAKEGLPKSYTSVPKVAIPRYMLEPTEPPFCWALKSKGSIKPEHLLWKTRVSLSRDVFFVQVGGENIVVDRAALAWALDQAGKIMELSALAKLSKKKRHGPFYALFNGVSRLPAALAGEKDVVEAFAMFRACVCPEVTKLVNCVLPNAWAVHVLGE